MSSGGLSQFLWAPCARSWSPHSKWSKGERTTSIWYNASDLHGLWFTGLLCALASAHSAIFSSQHSSHTHTTPQFLTHCITLQRQWMTFRSQDKPHVLSCLRVFLCLEYSSLVYYAFSPHPQPPWPETPTRPSSLSVDVAFPRNPSLSASPQDW